MKSRQEIVRQYITNEDIDIGWALRLGVDRFQNLEDIILHNEALCLHINNGIIPFDEYVIRYREAAINLSTPHLSDLIGVNGITEKDLIGLLGDEYRERLGNENIQRMIRSGDLNISDVNRFLDDRTLGYLNNPGLYDAIKHCIDNDIKISRKNNIFSSFYTGNYRSDAYKADNLNDPIVRQQIKDGKITLGRVLIQDGDLGYLLHFGPVVRLIENGSINLTEVLHADRSSLLNLESAALCELVSSRLISVGRALRLNFNEVRNVDSDNVRTLIVDTTLTLDQALGLSQEQREAIENPETFRMIQNGDLDIQLILGALDEDALHDIQSTHTASIHKSTSQSARNLMTRYGDKIQEDGAIDEIFIKIKEWSDSLLGGADRNDAIRRAVSRITDENYSHQDPESGVTIRQLLALSWLAVNDDSARFGDLSDALELFADGLYELQRGYNDDRLRQLGADVGDLSICPPGTFNKLVEKLAGVHPDVELIYITKETCSLKFPCVVADEAGRYFDKLRESGGDEWKTVADRVDKDGLEVIWGEISATVTARIFEEFGSIFTNVTDPSFTEIIDAYKYVDFKYPPVSSDPSERMSSPKVDEGTAVSALTEIQTLLGQAWNLLDNIENSRQMKIFIGSLSSMLMEVDDNPRLFAEFYKVWTERVSSDFSNLSSNVLSEEKYDSALHEVILHINQIVHAPAGTQPLNNDNAKSGASGQDVPEILHEIDRLIGVIKTGNPEQEDYRLIAKHLKILDPGNVASMYDEWKDLRASWQKSPKSTLFANPAPVCSIVPALENAKNLLDKSIDNISSLKSK